MGGTCRIARADVKRLETNFKISCSSVPLKGKIYVFGGAVSQDRRHRSRDESIPTEVFDPLTNSWSDAPHMPSLGASEHVVAIAGKLYIGGNNRAGQKGFTVSCFDPDTDGWEALPCMPDGEEPLI